MWKITETRNGRSAKVGMPGPQSVLSGGLLLVLAVFFLWALRDLSSEGGRAIGPALLPRTLAYGLAACGVALIGTGLVRRGEPLERVRLRGPAAVTASIVLFAATIGTFGLAVAGPLALVVGGFASPEMRLRELAVFAAVVTGACVLLFSTVLGLPMPILTFPHLFAI